MKKFKKITAVLLSAIITLLCMTPAYAEEKPIGVYLDGEPVDFGITNGKPVQALTLFDYAYVPVAKIVEILTGKAPDWNDATKTASFAYNGKSYDIDTTKSGIYIDGVFVESVTGTPPVIVNDRTLIPLKMLTSALNIEQKYDAGTHSTWLTTPPTASTAPAPAPAPSPEPKPAGDPVAIESVTPSTLTPVKGSSVTITIITSANAAKVWLSNPKKGNFAETSSGYSDSKNQRTWKIEYKVDLEDNQTFTAYAADSEGNTANKSFTLNIGSNAVPVILEAYADPTNIETGGSTSIYVITNTSVESISYSVSSGNGSMQTDTQTNYSESGNRRIWSHSIYKASDIPEIVKISITAVSGSGAKAAATVAVTVEGQDSEDINIYSIKANGSYSRIKPGEQLEYTITTGAAVTQVDINIGDESFGSCTLTSTNGNRKIWSAVFTGPYYVGSNRITFTTYGVFGLGTKSSSVTVYVDDAGGY